MTRRLTLSAAFAALALAAVVLYTSRSARPVSAAYRVHLPAVVSGACNHGQPKRGVAPVEAGVHYQGPLCLPAGFLCSTWAAVPDQAQCRGGTTIPMAYASAENFREHYGRDFSGLTLFANEPDLPDQAGLTVAETAALACELQAYAPDVQLAGPAYSADGWHLMRAFWDAYADCNGGHDAIVAHVAHIYAVAGSPYPATMLAAFYDALPAAQRHKPVYVHETGWHESADLDMGRWLRELDGDGRVLGYGWFAPFPAASGRYSHWQNLMGRDGRLTELGRVFSGR